MTTPSSSDGTPRPDGDPGGDAPFLPPARPAVPAPAAPTHEPPAAPGPEPTPAPSTAAPTDTPFLPSARPREPVKPATAPAFDAKAMVESQKHFNPDPAYGALPAGSEESRAAARKLREEANRKRRRGRVAGRLVGLLVLAGLAVGAYLLYKALQDDPPPADGVTDEPDADADADAGGTGEGGALTPLGEQELVIEALDDINSGARPSAGGLLDAVEDARDVVGQAEPPVGAPSTLIVADVFTPAILDHTDVLDPADGWERFVVRSGELEEIDPSARTALVEQLLALPQVADGDPQLAVAPVVLPGDIGIAIQRDGDRITRLVAVGADPAIRAVGP